MRRSSSLYEAALEDDDLFAALADEHALKELLDDSNVRAQLLRATEEPKFTVAGAFREWLERPKAKALIATGAVLLAIIAFKTGRESVEEKYEQVAEVRQPVAEPARPAVPQAQPKASPAPQRKAAKLKVEKDAPVTAREAPAPATAPQPPAAPARGVVGGVVGGVIGGVPEPRRCGTRRRKPRTARRRLYMNCYANRPMASSGRQRPIPRLQRAILSRFG